MESNFSIINTRVPYPEFVEVVNHHYANCYITYGYYYSSLIGSEKTVAIFKIKYK